MLIYFRQILRDGLFVSIYFKPTDLPIFFNFRPLNDYSIWYSLILNYSYSYSHSPMYDATTHAMLTNQTVLTEIFSKTADLSYGLLIRKPEDMEYFGMIFLCLGAIHKGYPARIGIFRPTQSQMIGHVFLAFDNVH